MKIDKQSLILELFALQAVKFGEFPLKSGKLSPIYLDLRVMISYPKFLKKISEALWQMMHDLSYDLICGVPYAALPLATALSIEHDIPMIIRRKEAKAYGTKKLIEGVYKPNETCLIIEDVVTTGQSIVETVKPLEEEKLHVRDILVVIDRNQGGREKIENAGYHLHPLLTLKECLKVLFETKNIDAKTVEKVEAFLMETSPI